MDVSARFCVAIPLLINSTTRISRSSTAQHPVSMILPKKQPKSSPPLSDPPSEPPKANELKRLRNKRRNERSAKAMMEKANQTRPNNS